MVIDEVLLKRFAGAFNGKDLDGLAELLASDATAEVLNSGFPVEKGREVIRKTSLPYILDSEVPLTAEVWVDEGVGYVLLRESGGNRALDMALRLICAGGAIQRIEYWVQDHRPDDVSRIGVKAGIAVRPGKPK